MTILVKMPQIWGKIRPKTHRFEAKIGQKSCILMQNDSIFGEKWRSEFLRCSCCSCCSFFSRGRCGWSFWWSKPVMVILVKIGFRVRWAISLVSGRDKAYRFERKGMLLWEKRHISQIAFRYPHFLHQNRSNLIDNISKRGLRPIFQNARFCTKVG